MNRGEFEGLKARFGSDIAAWPAPYRQEALQFLAAHNDDAISNDAKFDRLVLEAMTEPTDERRLIGHVMAEIAKPRRRTFALAIAPEAWKIPAAAASMALVATLSAASGYMTAGRGADVSDNALLAFAMGLPPSGLVDTIVITREEGGRP